MNDVSIKEKELEHTINEPIINAQFDLSSTDKHLIERVCDSFINFARIYAPDCKDVCRLKTLKGDITTRKAPCGNGTASWDRYRISVHQRRYNFSIPNSVLEKFINFLKGTNVDITLTIKKK
ncbi:40S ribosomal S20 [Tubulinosema ratisbonensis]|uniref:40S ribosomal S20 n=1 Tax=Tubulinosema ratisbonensis TaxID=291195 RepID=A0A437AND8_9MICR|nr:40S ribosomal S20 [Tubulinosema ratisbonensis]